MYGAGVGELRVYVKSGGKMDFMWSLSGNQGDKWNPAQVTVNDQTASYQYVIEGVRGKDIKGDIAIDDISLMISCLSGGFSAITRHRPRTQHGRLRGRNLMQQKSRGKRSRQKSRSSSPDSADGDQTTSPKRARLEDEQNDDVAVLLAESQPQGENSGNDNEKEFGAILDSVVQELDEEQLGPDVSEKLAQVINKTLRSKLSEEKLKEKQNAYPRPQNCESLETTRVNPEIWAQLQSSTRSRDIRLQKVQSLLLKGLLPLVQLLENCRQSDDRSTDKGKIIKPALDSVSLVAQANVELNSLRRALIKPGLNEKFQQICGDHVPITTLLFGDDVAKTLQDIASTNRVSQKAATPTHQWILKATQGVEIEFLMKPFQLQSPKELTVSSSEECIVDNEIIKLMKGDMTVSLTSERATKLQTACINLLAKRRPLIQEGAHVIGLMVASFPSVTFAQLFYRALERDKTQALKLHKGNYAANMTLSQDALADLQWWISNIETSSKPVLASQPDMPVNKSFAKDPGGISRGYTDNTPVAYTTVVPCGNANVGQPPTDFAQNATSTLLTSQSGQDAPTTSETQTTGMSLIWKSFQSQGILNQAAHIIIKSWRSETVQQYQTYLNKWALFCSERQVNPFSPSLTDVLDFFTVL
ncbi:Tyrosine- kinase Tec [Paramuricea clavata]|uniref:Tyrosine- kinase Tec n=1 Tax=Paramuricea clavata TaxID=317549 RepID=A0A7D9EAJ4_PARCT|nr:Tyrosine- kinase Tec [Paramuricea clavata]